jgi:tetratricopeptide (TPR) repeat protein
MKKILVGAVIAVIILIGLLAFFISSETPIGGMNDLPLYTGQAIEELGDDPIHEQVPVEKLEEIQKELAKTRLVLQENADNFDAWMYIAQTKKFFNNYEGARDAWEYAIFVEPEFGVAYFNLANLYGFYLEDEEKAEIYFTKAIQYDKGVPYPYIGAVEYYKGRGMIEKARGILEQGLKEIPENSDLTHALKFL